MITYPLNNIEYVAEDAELWMSTRTSGILSLEDFKLSITDSARATVSISAGISWIHNSRFSGKVAAQKEQISLQMIAPDNIYNRIDIIAIQFNAAQNVTNIIVKQGGGAENPQIPSISKTEGLYELYLYAVKRNAGKTKLESYEITDLRIDRNYCGLMLDTATVDPAMMINYIYPIGSIYMSTHSTSPASFIGGSWERIYDKFIVGGGSSYDVGSMGGNATHVITTEEMPAHSHVQRIGDVDLNPMVSADNGTNSGIENTFSTTWASNRQVVTTGVQGRSQAFSIIPPYLAVYMWKRVS